DWSTEFSTAAVSQTQGGALIGTRLRPAVNRTSAGESSAGASRGWPWYAEDTADRVLPAGASPARVDVPWVPPPGTPPALGPHPRRRSVTNNVTHVSATPSTTITRRYEATPAPDLQQEI